MDVEREALTVPPPPDGPARITLDPEGFVVRRPDARTLARDALVVGVVVATLVAMLAGLVALLARGFSGWMCLLFVSPALLSAIGLPPMRRLAYAARGAQVVLCTPSELVIAYGGGVQRIALADIRHVRSAAMGEILVDAGGEQMIELAASEEQTHWLVLAIRAAARGQVYSLLL
jgi:hypothetical protein